MNYNAIRQGTSGDIEEKISFQHCILHSFDEILHGVSPWVGHRLIQHFNLKKELYSIFKHLVIKIMANMKKMVFQNIHYIRI